mgnify:CR=1 FL=1
MDLAEWSQHLLRLMKLGISAFAVKRIGSFGNGIHHAVPYAFGVEDQTLLENVLPKYHGIKVGLLQQFAERSRHEYTSLLVCLCVDIADKSHVRTLVNIEICHKDIKFPTIPHFFFVCFLGTLKLFFCAPS